MHNAWSLPAVCMWQMFAAASCIGGHFWGFQETFLLGLSKHSFILGRVLQGASPEHPTLCSLLLVDSTFHVKLHSWGRIHFNMTPTFPTYCRSDPQVHEPLISAKAGQGSIHLNQALTGNGATMIVLCVWVLRCVCAHWVSDLWMKALKLKRWRAECLG